jgi:hypothetical protein
VQSAGSPVFLPPTLVPLEILVDNVYFEKQSIKIGKQAGEFFEGPEGGWS